jgi:hypothetical protein
MKGIEAASAIKGMMPQVPIVLFTLYGEAVENMAIRAFFRELDLVHNWCTIS